MKANMITRTINTVTVKGKSLKGFNGTTPIFEDVTYTVTNPRNTEQDTLRKAIKRNYWAKAERELMVIETVSENPQRYGMTEEQFFNMATLLSESPEDTPTENPLP